MQFHEDLMFKNIPYDYGQMFMEILGLKGKIIRFYPTELTIIDPKFYKPDLIIETEDKIYILEFQSSKVELKDKKRFRFYSALIDHIHNKSNKKIEVHILSTVEEEQSLVYKINDYSKFFMMMHSLKAFDGDKFLEEYLLKISADEELTIKELLYLALIPFMDSESSVENQILKTSVLLSKIRNVDEDLIRFVKGVELIISDKFVKNEVKRETISNLLGGNMKIIDEYVQRLFDNGLNEELERRVDEEFNKMLDAAVKEEVEKEINNRIDAEVEREVSSRIDAEVEKEINNRIDEGIEKETKQKLEESYSNIIKKLNENFKKEEIIKFTDFDEKFVERVLSEG